MFVFSYNNTYSKRCGSWRQYYRSESALNAAGNITDFPADNNNSVSFEFKTKITGKTESNDTKMWIYLVICNI